MSNELTNMINDVMTCGTWKKGHDCRVGCKNDKKEYRCEEYGGSCDMIQDSIYCYEFRDKNELRQDVLEES